MLTAGEPGRLGPHIPVMPEEVEQALRVRAGARYVDATVGEGHV